MRRLGWLAPTVAAAAMLLAACGGSDNGGGGGSSSNAQSSKPIRIGASLPLTGDFSEPGKAARQGYQVWQKMVNDQGGLLGRKVQIIVRDDASDQNTVVADYNALISRQKVDMLLGTFSSLLNLPASTVAERNRKLYVEPAGGAPDIFNRGYKHIFFAQQATADHQGDVFADYILKLPPDQRPKTAAYPSLDDPFALPVLDGIREKFEKAGIKTVYRTKYANENTNFDSIANAVKAAKPDVLMHGATFADGVNFVRALDKVGYSPKYFFQTSAPSFADQYSKGVGVENTEGTFYAVSWDAKAKTPGNAEFVKTFNSMFGAGEPAEDAADAFAAAQVMQAAVKAVGSINDQTKLADWIRSNSVNTILGPLKWDKTGAPQGQFLIGQWQNGKSQIVLPKDAATSQTIVQKNAGA
jgi:branched-chain amino acid transport system substrate-binding protein